MGTNFHTAWTTSNVVTAASLTPVPSSLDKAITYAKNLMIHCDGKIWWDRIAGKLYWDSTITILFNREDGKAIKNTIAANTSGLAIADNQFAYVDLNETDATVLTAAVATVTTNSASNYVAVNRLCLCYRNTTSDEVFSIVLNNMIENIFQVQTTDATVTTLYSKTLTTGKSYHIKAIVAAKNGNTERADYVRRACVYRAAGAAVLEGSVQDAFTVESSGASAWDCTIDVNSNDVRVRVTGAGSTTIDWKTKIEIMEI